MRKGAVDLVLRALGLGDLLTAVPALRALRRAWPDDHLVLAAPRSLEPLVRLIGAVDELLPTAGLAQFPVDVRNGHDDDHQPRDGADHHPGSDHHLGKDHRRGHDHARSHHGRRDQGVGYRPWFLDHQPSDRQDQQGLIRPAGSRTDLLEHGIRCAVNLHGSGPESIRHLRDLAPAQLITHAHPDVPGVTGPGWDPEQHEIDRWCALLAAFGIPSDPTDLRLDPPPLASPYPGAVVVHPGASFQARRWPPDRFADVAHQLAAEGHQVVITGNAYERKLCCWTAERAGLPESVVLAGHTDLAELAAVVAAAELVICGDTGTGHLATALDTPSVLLFGPTPPSRWGPRISPERHVGLWAGHIGDPLGSRRDPGLLRLQVDDVLDSAHRVLQAS